MILVDLNQIALGALIAQITDTKKKITEEFVRHTALNAIRNNIKKFRREYGQVVIACDNRKYWRKEYFPYYKAGRKKTRDKSDLDWHMIFEALAKLKSELRDNFPYKVIDVEGAEADDVIGTLAPRHVMHENVLIVSSDGDFLQLQQYNARSKYQIKQYNPSQKKFVTSDNPLLDLKEKIIRGDRGDGIPNILSPSDCFILEIRQKRLTEAIMEKYMNTERGDWVDENAKIGFSRNETLIDLRLIPNDIKDKVINTYEEVKPANRTKMLNYFIDKNLKNLMDVIEEF